MDAAQDEGHELTTATNASFTRSDGPGKLQSAHAKLHTQGRKLHCSAQPDEASSLRGRRARKLKKGELHSEPNLLNSAASLCEPYRPGLRQMAAPPSWADALAADQKRMKVTLEDAKLTTNALRDRSKYNTEDNSTGVRVVRMQVS